MAHTNANNNNTSRYTGRQKERLRTNGVRDENVHEVDERSALVAEKNGDHTQIKKENWWWVIKGKEKAGRGHLQ